MKFGPRAVQSVQRTVTCHVVDPAWPYWPYMKMLGCPPQNGQGLSLFGIRGGPFKVVRGVVLPWSGGYGASLSGATAPGPAPGPTNKTSHGSHSQYTAIPAAGSGQRSVGTLQHLGQTTRGGAGVRSHAVTLEVLCQQKTSQHVEASFAL